VFFQQAARYPLLTAAQEIELAKRIERGDLEAKDRMITSNLRLVIHVARGYRGQGFAVPRFDPGRDCWPDPRSREVRLAEGVQVLHLRDALDSPRRSSAASRTPGVPSGFRRTSGSASARWRVPSVT